MEKLPGIIKSNAINLSVLLMLSVISFDAISGQEPVQVKKKKEKYLQLYVGNTTNDTQSADVYRINTTDSTVGIGGGFQFGGNMFLDVRFVDLGTYKTSSDLYEESFKALTGSLLARLPLGSSGFNLYGSIGYGIISWEYEINSIIRARVKDSGDTLTGGFGVQYKIPGSRFFAISLGYDQYYFRTEPMFGNGDSHGNTIEFVSLSLQYRK